jgi:hypothetical protein
LFSFFRPLYCLPFCHILILLSTLVSLQTFCVWLLWHVRVLNCANICMLLLFKHCVLWNRNTFLSDYIAAIH